MTPSPPFDFDEVFDDDYLFFYADRLNDERSDSDAEAVRKLIGDPPLDVLDLASGHGRIANRLAGAGYSVVGLDATPRYLDRARTDAAGRGLSVEYVHGDMRALPWTARFDAVVNWFTAFGYFSDEQNRGVLQQLYTALKPGGLLLIETLCCEFITRHLTPSQVLEREGAFMIDLHEWRPEAGTIQSERIVIKDGHTRRFQFSVRLLALPEFRSWLEEAGFGDVEFLSGLGDAFSPDVPRLIVRARKPA